METRTQLKSVIFTTDIFAVYVILRPIGQAQYPNTMVPVSNVQPSLNEAVGLQIFFHHSDILSCITFYIK